MNDPIRRLAYGILTLFLVLAVATTWTQAVVGPDYRDDPRNVRLMAFRIGRERGVIVTRDGTVVAVSEPAPDEPRAFRRVYPEGEVYAHLVGYVSVLFDAAGLEAARGRDLVSNRGNTISGVLGVLFGDDPRPRGLLLTVDDTLQRAARDALGD
ncbi:MAG TPA: penicillin-binding protein 2, partial [Actinobacteria bacterium]|nr:penicillin-binding protein 2 [Actinomycetota bacterium]